MISRAPPRREATIRARSFAVGQWPSHGERADSGPRPRRPGGPFHTHPTGRGGARSFVDDLILSRGVVHGRAASCCDPLRLSLSDSRICVRVDEHPSNTMQSLLFALFLGLRAGKPVDVSPVGTLKSSLLWGDTFPFDSLVLRPRATSSGARRRWLCLFVTVSRAKSRGACANSPL